MSNSNFATKRLTRDLRFLSRHPVVGSALSPLENDLFTWHGNVLINDVPVHYTVQFTSRYPDEAPTITFSTPVPHPSVTSTRRLCSEMLGNSDWLHDAAVADSAWSGWSSAYSPYSLMMQVASLATDELFAHHNGVTPAEASLRAASFECKQCGHHGTHCQWPAVASPQDVAQSVRQGLQYVPLPIPVVVLSREESVVESPQQPETHSAESTPVAPVAVVGNGLKRKAAAKKVKKAKAQQSKDAGWTTVSYHTKPKQKKSIASGRVKTSNAKSAPKQGPTSLVPVSSHVASVKSLPVGAESAAARKNRLRRKHKRERRRMEAAATKNNKQTGAGAEKKEKKKKTSSENKSPKLSPQVKKSKKAVALGSTRENMGLFGKLSSDVMTYLCSYLNLPDVLTMAQLSKGLNKMASGAFLWRDIYERKFPNSTPAGMMDFRHGYTLRVQGIVSELICFHTKKSLAEDPLTILGYGVMFTRNPKAGRIDYIDVTEDLMSLEAFQKRKVRVGSKGEEIQEFLPLYLTEEHWERAFPQFRKSILRMYSETPFLEGAVDFLCAALNTRSVLLADKGVSASYSAMASYSQLQRVFLALCSSLNGVQQVVDRRVSSFMESEYNREKNRVRSLGDFLPLMLVTKVATWPQVRALFLKEVFARNTLWACRGAPELAHLDKAMPAMRRLELTWQGTQVSNRLIMLSSMFLNVSRRGQSLAQLTRSLDRFYGSASLSQLQEMKTAVGAILGQSAGWPMYFKMVCGTKVTPDRVEALLKEAVRDSRRKGYHSKHTNFAAVHSSGVSKILRKGESYTTAKNVNEVMLSLGWNFPAGVIFLDASCLIYDGANYMGVIDFQTCYEPTGMSILHSGDQIDNERKSGEHGIRVRLQDVPRAVDTLYLVLSAWTQNLSAIRNPWIRLVDSRSPDADLCTYTLESAGSSQAVVMAKVVRQLSGWKVIPLGITSVGTVRDYAPVRETIKNIERTQRYNKEAKA